MIGQKSITYLVSILPFTFILLNAYYNTDIINPFSYLITSTGFIALTFLIIIITIPIFKRLNQFFDRRILGLMTFTYSCIHLIIYVLDNNISFTYLLADILNLTYIQTGYLAFILFFPLVFTSTKTAQVILKKNWFKIHKLIYLIISLSFLHYFLIIKADYGLFLTYLMLLLFILILKQWRTFNE